MALFGCPTSARLTMKANLGVQITTQDPDTGEITRVWVYADEIDCEVRPVMEGGIRVAGTTERFDDIYENVEWAFLLTDMPLSDRDRIRNIRDSNGRSVYPDMNDLTAGASVEFEVLGSMPILDPFNRVTLYRTLIHRADVQDAG